MRLVKKGPTRQLVDDKDNKVSVTLRNCVAASDIFKTKTAYYCILNVPHDQELIDIETLLTTQFRLDLEGSPFNGDKSTLLVKLPFRARFESQFYDRLGYETGSHIVAKGELYNVELTFGGVWNNNKGYSYKLTKMYQI